MDTPEYAHVLYPTDFSESAEAAFPYALALAARRGATLHMLHVVTPHDYDPHADDVAFSSVEEFLKTMAGRAEEDLAGKAAGARAIRIPVVKTVVRGLSTHESILDYIRDNKIDLVVMSTHGRSGLKHMLFGSVAEGVLRHCTKPVWLVKQNEQRCLAPSGNSLDIRKILIPTDLSENSARSAVWARRLADGSDIEVHYLHVVTTHFHPAYFAGGISSIFQLDPGLRDRLRTRITNLFNIHEQRQVEHIHITEGKVAAGIVDFAGENDIDLIIMANNGYDEIEDYLVGSTTERVIRMAEWPVFVV